MECKVCGRHAENENANFCENCGNSFRKNYQNYQNASPQYNQWQSNANNQGNNTYASGNTNGYGPSSPYSSQSGTSNREEEPVSFKSWLLILALPFLLLFIPIPFVGPLAYIVLLFVWAFGKDTQPSKKNWARANLVISSILFIIIIIFTIYVFTALVNGTFPLEGLDGFNGLKGLEGFY